MKNRVLPSLFLALALTAGTGCATLNDVLNSSIPVSTDPTLSEMSGGLKDALGNGISSAVNILGAPGGFSKDPLIRIPFPQEAQFAANTLRDIGLGKLVDDFENKLNEGAEKAALKALPIFGNAIRAMTFNDVKNILLGGENAATNYFKQATSQELYNAFAPEVNQVLGEVGVNTLWTEISTRYNSIPFTQRKVETDLVKYATNKAMDGLFAKVAEEEAKIRKEPIARSTELMRKVFSYADRQRAGQQ